MEPNVKLYQKVANHFKSDMTNGVYKVGDMLPAERLLSEQMKVSRTVIREAMIMLEVEGFVEVRKGSGIRVIRTDAGPSTKNDISGDLNFMLTCGPFELLQARQLLESSIAEFAATQATKQDLVALMKVQEKAKSNDYTRDSYWDSEFHIQLARCTQNSTIVHIAELLCQHRENNPYWQKLHEHIEDNQIRSWCTEHDEIVAALVKRNPQEARQAVWQHIENTKKMLFEGSSDDYDRFLFAESPNLTY
ncbi:FCD domain-containing protein [Vibrio salinus]|uniref:FCD domain-containing protein n=1 Tax=Vibrio salinus TaxID=2899784 RepID=UPI001E4105DC|nr:FCD domain-containing protein [Vibrio salinus]MCE0495165.1 GntR family transcriptional regulator [Vibrio salinus]